MAENIKLSPTRIYAMLMIGTGLLAIGLMSIMFLSNSAATAQDFSVVPIKVDFPAPELSLVDLAGNTVSLKDHLGSVVLVNLWATWCPPCKEEMPTLQAFYKKYNSSGFVLLAIDQEESIEIVMPFVKEYGLTFPVWLDEEYLSQRVFNTMNLPSSYVIDRVGTVRLMWIGGISKRNLEKYVPDLILE